MLEQVNQFPDRYNFEGELGRGGFGSVLQAYDSVQGQSVAVKKIYVNPYDEMSAARVLRELKVIKLFTKLSQQTKSESNIVKFVDLHIRESYTQPSYLVMIFQEMMDTNLDSAIQRCYNGQMNWKLSERYYILMQIINGINELHQLNILHRDLASKNVLINLDDLTVKVSDFGLSRYYSTRITKGKVSRYSTLHKQMNEMVCSLQYRAPELLVFEFQNVIMGEVITPKIDVWGIGCIFFELLTLQKLVDFDILHLPEYLRGDFRGFKRYVGGANPKFVSDVCYLAKQSSPYITPNGLKFLSQLLDLDPIKRIDTNRMDSHQFIKDIKYKLSLPKFTDYKFRDFKSLDLSFAFEELDYGNGQQLVLKQLLNQKLSSSIVNSPYGSPYASAHSSSTSLGSRSSSGGPIVLAQRPPMRKSGSWFSSKLSQNGSVNRQSRSYTGSLPGFDIPVRAAPSLAQVVGNGKSHSYRH